MFIKFLDRLFIALFLILFIESNLFAQKYKNSISGVIIDNLTAQPIENVNVYIANTTFGSSTDKDGFYLIYSIPPNQHDLIVSAVGYNTIEQKVFVTKKSKIRHNFALRPVIYKTHPIDVIANFPDNWLKNLDKFKDKFLGQTFRADYCELENPEVLNFNDSTYILKASIQNPLIIKNAILGYKIYCNSLDFQFNPAKNIWSWKIKPHFEEFISEDSLQIKSCKINRQIAYFGSMYHFLASLKHKRIKENEYNLFITDKPYKSLESVNYTIFKADTDSILIPNLNKQYHTLKFDKLLLVKNYSIENHIKNKYNLNIKFGDTYMKSWLKLKFGEMTIDNYGYPIEEDAFIVRGYWATLGVADLLPRYFEY